jgi:hypothetical protein
MFASSMIKFALDISKPCTPLFMQTIKPCRSGLSALDHTFLNLKYLNHGILKPTSLNSQFHESKTLHARNRNLKYWKYKP